ncbi:MAG: SUMF1/EgtB/PvdO family nonheme iron enzyme, partial [Myxococcales bacterium]|nr:SUMF1/EgtB/PvdO family nonheme iron enzyme [Myxococcales bacterium]
LEPLPLVLPSATDLGPDDVYVPAGWFWCGGDHDAVDTLPRRRVYVDGFVMRRFPVTNGEYLAFLNALVDAGRAEDANRCSPRAPLSMPASDDEQQGRSFVRGEDGRFDVAARGPARDVVLASPAALIDWNSAMAYAEWYAEHTGLPWRLPDELEWEKAARGVDGRFFPWGDDSTAPWARILGFYPGEVRSAPVDSYPTDESPFGVRGMGGNVRDWCINIWTHDGPPIANGRVVVVPAPPDGDEHRSMRGGSLTSHMRFCRVASRFANRPHQSFGIVGFRLVYPVDPLLRAGR